MTLIIENLFLVAGILFLLVLVYYFFLAIVSIWPERSVKAPVPAAVKFAVVVPAHNEARVIGRTLESLRTVDYPRHLYEVFVIADNCDDDTAGIVRETGVVCWERRNPDQRGKGFVLDWAFSRLLQTGDHDAFAVIDADTLVDPAFFTAMNRAIAQGSKAVQGYYDVLNPERSPMASLSYLGFVLSRNLRYRGRTRLGWTSNLLGNGMCFTRKVIEQLGWPATSIVEDIEYEMILLLNGVRVDFVPDARVYAEIPDTFAASQAQRGRWDIGKFTVRNRYLPPLLREGIRRRELRYFDAAAELMIPPFSLFVLAAAAGFLTFLLADFSELGINFFVWCSVMAGTALYVIGGLMLAPAKWRLYRSLLYVPFFLLWRPWVLIRGVIHRNHTRWVKTARE